MQAIEANIDHIEEQVVAESEVTPVAEVVEAQTPSEEATEAVAQAVADAITFSGDGSDGLDLEAHGNNTSAESADETQDGEDASAVSSVLEQL